MRSIIQDAYTANPARKILRVFEGRALLECTHTIEPNASQLEYARAYCPHCKAEAKQAFLALVLAATESTDERVLSALSSLLLVSASRNEAIRALAAKSILPE